MADWDPTAAQPGAPSKPALHRARVDYRRLCEEPLEGIVAVPDAKDAMKFHVLVSGPTGTPYEGGSFYFLLRLPNDYPHSPPRARIMTTGGGVVRFNPNLYANGKVRRGRGAGGRADGPARGGHTGTLARRALACAVRLRGGLAQR
jgi:ubiquitin-conjugating enzyme E2 Z